MNVTFEIKDLFVKIKILFCFLDETSFYGSIHNHATAASVAGTVQFDSELAFGFQKIQSSSVHEFILSSFTLMCQTFFLCILILLQKILAFFPLYSWLENGLQRSWATLPHPNTLPFTFPCNVQNLEKKKQIF